MIVRLVLAGVLVAASLVAQSADDAAERAYADGHFARAQELFLARLNALPADAADAAVRGALHQNIAAAAFRNGEDVTAVLHYRRAEHWLGPDARLVADRRRAERRLGLDSMAPPLREVVARRIDAWPVAAVAALGAALQLAGLVAWFYCRRRRGELRLASAGLVLLGLALNAHLVHRSISGQPASLGVVAPQGDRRELALRAEPHRGMPVVATLRAGETVSVVESSDRWTHVRVIGDSGPSGWCPRGEVAPVGPR